MRRLARLVVGTLLRGSTYRRWGFMLAGAVLLVPYVAIYLSILMSILHGGQGDAFAGIVIALGWIPLSTAVAFLRPIRLLERTAAVTLLDVGLPEETAEGAASWRSRRRTAGWYVLHLLLGGLCAAVLLYGVPLTLTLIEAPFLSKPQPLGVFGISAAAHGPWSLVAGLALLVALFTFGTTLGALMARLAPTLLGPSPADRVAQLEHQKDQLVERNRLARELHDSVGHALTVTTLQAAAARQLLDTDPDFARRALAAIEETGRAALEDLDHVLGLLRDDVSTRTPQRTLADLEALLDSTRDAGVEVRAEVGDGVGDVPPVVSREAYRIIQEGLTNALRHAGKVPITLRLAVRSERLELEMVNPIGASAPTRANGGRGLAGIRERVTILGGQMNAEAGDEWRITVRLPLRWAS
jgi:signal transduction histidine kinase